MKKNSFVEGTIIATLAIVFTKILGMLYVIPFYSIIGSQGSSLYSYAYNIYMIFLSISSAGIPTAMSKIVSEYESQGMREAKVRSFKIGIFIVSILSVLCFLVLIFFLSYVFNKKTPVPPGCENIKISDENCMACGNTDCHIKKEIDFDKIKEDIKEDK